MHEYMGFGGSLAQQLRSNARTAQSALNRCVSPDSFTRREHSSAFDLLRVGDAFHAEFLSSAVELESVEAMRRYTSWACNVLESRNVSCGTIAEYLGNLSQEYKRTMPSEHWTAVAPFVYSALDVCANKLSEQQTCVSAKTELECQEEEFLSAVLAGAKLRALNLARETVGHSWFREPAYCDLVEHTMQEVGRMWEWNQITVATEHLASTTTQAVINQLYPLLKVHSPTLGRALITGVQGDHHQIGAQLVADVLEIAGWDVLFLGSDLPARDVAKLVRHWEPDVVGISATLLIHLSSVKNLIERIRAERPKVRIIVGGAAFQDVSQGFLNHIGANLYARSALEARGLLAP